MKPKQLILVAGVVISLGLYSFVFRHDNATTVTPPASLKQGSSSAPAASGSTPASSSAAATYKDGTYTGSAANAYYGDIQVAATIQNGKITTVKFLQYPNDQPNSVSINTQAMPYLQQEAIQAQSAQIDVVTGATDTSNAFVQSLSSALSQAAM